MKKMSEKITPDLQEVDVSQLVITSHEEAAVVAEAILQVLEEDLFQANQQGKLGRIIHRHLSDPDLEKQRRKKWLQDYESKYSLVSNLSEVDFHLHAPSTMELFYRKGANPRRYEKLKALEESERVDNEVQVNIHREGMDGPSHKTVMTQTLEILSMRPTQARMEFMKMYPAPDHWITPRVNSRSASLENVLQKLEGSVTYDDTPPVGPKPRYRKPLKERLLKPVSGDFQKTEISWTGSVYKGDFSDRAFAYGHYIYPTWATYESEFKDGNIHSKKHFGVIRYPRGDTFEGTWKNGRFVDGQITFADGLRFEPIGWKYCTPPDRRFYIERSHGVHGVGQTYYSDQFPPPELPYGCYDVGDGIYNPETGKVISYTGVFLRKTTVYEHRWILANCRRRKPLDECYEPCFMEERMPDTYAHRFPKNT